MKTILIMGLCLMLSLSVVSASYDFNYEKPDLDEYTNPLWLLAKEIGSMNKLVLMAYAIFQDSRELENRLILAEKEITRLKAKSCSSRSSPTPQTAPVIVDEEDEEITYNEDGWADFKKNYPKEGCSDDNNWCSFSDINRDGNVDISDLSLFASKYDPIKNHYGRTDCSDDNDWCHNYDKDNDGDVDLSDLSNSI